MNLCCQLACRREHQCAAAARLGLGSVLQQPMNQRQSECRGLSGASLGAAKEVTAREDLRHGLFLDWSRRAVALFAEASQQTLCEFEVGKAIRSYGCAVRHRHVMFGGSMFWSVMFGSVVLRVTRPTSRAARGGATPLLKRSLPTMLLTEAAWALLVV
jgi:hypothetical protein